MSDNKDIYCTTMTRVAVDTDLTESAIETSIETLRKSSYQEPMVLIVSQDNAFRAGQICQKYNFSCVVLPKELIPCDAWALAGQFSAVWSPGA